MLFVCFGARVCVCMYSRMCVSAACAESSRGRVRLQEHTAVTIPDWRGWRREDMSVGEGNPDHDSRLGLSSRRSRFTIRRATPTIHDQD